MRQSIWFLAFLSQAIAILIAPLQPSVNVAVIIVQGYILFYLISVLG